MWPYWSAETLEEQAGLNQPFLWIWWGRSGAWVPEAHLSCRWSSCCQTQSPLRGASLGVGVSGTPKAPPFLGLCIQSPSPQRSSGREKASTWVRNQGLAHGDISPTHSWARPTWVFTSTKTIEDPDDLQLCSPPSDTFSYYSQSLRPSNTKWKARGGAEETAGQVNQLLC